MVDIFSQRQKIAFADVISDEHGIAPIAQKFNVGTATPMGGISPQRQKNTLWQCLALCSSGACRRRLSGMGNLRLYTRLVTAVLLRCQ
jgi:hypothetical protein